MPRLEDWSISVKTAAAILAAAGAVYVGYLRVVSYEATVRALEAEVKAGNAKIAALDRSVVELTVELRTRGVIHAGQ